MAPPAKKGVDAAGKAKAAQKAVEVGTMKKKSLKKRFSVTFHRCVADAGCAV